MRTIEVDVVITEDGKLLGEVPSGVAPGKHHVKLVFEDYPGATMDDELGILVIHVDSWPDNVSLRREDMYGDNGR